MTTRRIVVGIDDSGPARYALRWALEEATLLGRELDVVHVYQLPVVLVPPPVPSPAAMGPDIRSRAEALVHRLTSEALGGSAHRPPAVHEIVVEGFPGRTLVSCAKPGDTLVVGARGRGAVVSTVLGSCSQNCLHHAPCPVVVVPGSRE